MMADILKNLDVVKVLVLGGTGTQGLSIVQGVSCARRNQLRQFSKVLSSDPQPAIAHSQRYRVSVLTRDPKSSKALDVQNKYGVQLIPGSYATEEGLRAAFEGQDVCYFNIDSFQVGEPQEYFWTFRAYEIAVQSKLKWFIFSGAGVDRYADHGFAEEYRNSHNIVASRLSGWLAAQPLERLPWSIISGGVYAEMLNSLLRPIKDELGFRFASPVREDSIIPLIPLEMYGIRFRWMLENPEKSVGRSLSSAPFNVTFPEVAEAFAKVNNVPARFEPATIDEWMSLVNASIPVDDTLPRGSQKDDPTTFTFRRSFTAWWKLWRDSLEDLEGGKAAAEWAESYYPQRGKDIEEWMRRTEYGLSFL
jgi:hypothetical protein